jgi:hypothetical protein
VPPPVLNDLAAHAFALRSYKSKESIVISARAALLAPGSHDGMASTPEERPCIDELQVGGLRW